ncbi:DinB family protein [Ekhidna sp.]|uniref:DinB family protein n=1 Tax=Ekhidna sp. TaxID=2608089 RepID=UPI003BAACBD0
MHILKCFILSFIVLSSIPSLAQDGDSTDFYYQIPDYPQGYDAGSVAARVVDGLGFRYYWATEGLTEGDLQFRPSEGARNVEETIDHIINLTQILANAVQEKSFDGVAYDEMTFAQKRELTLENIRVASEILKTSNAENLEKFDMIFSSGAEFPFWNLLNGPVADAINHVGQIITLRRTNGNPINQNISVLQGRVRG